MAESPNPYQSPPSSLADRQSWWSRLRNLFRAPPSRREPVFEKGDAIVCEGIAFCIDPENPAVLYATSPSTDHSDQRLNLIASETLRVLPRFLADHRELYVHLDGRHVTVGIIGDYDQPHALHREVALQWMIRDAALAYDAAK